MKQEFIPNNGRIAVVREAAAPKWKLGQLELDKTDETKEYQTKANPWALVVGVGKPEVTAYGTKITTHIEPGDKVAVAQVGLYLPLETSDGVTDWIYVVPFDGIMGSVQARCENKDCGYVERKGSAVMGLVCPKCGDGRQPEIVQPSTADVIAIRGGK